MLWSIGFPLGWGPTGEHEMWAVLFNINRFGIELLIYGFIIGITGIVQYKQRAQQDAMRSLELQKQLSSAHLRTLQMQLEPHFLFNTLNAITTLVELGRQSEAVEMLSHLNLILKSTLKRTTPEKVPLSQELEMIDIRSDCWYRMAREIPWCIFKRSSGSRPRTTTRACTLGRRASCCARQSSSWPTRLIQIGSYGFTARLL
jgi:Histidine kinase